MPPLLPAREKIRVKAIWYEMFDCLCIYFGNIWQTNILHNVECGSMRCVTAYSTILKKYGKLTYYIFCVCGGNMQQIMYPDKATMEVHSYEVGSQAKMLGNSLSNRPSNDHLHEPIILIVELLVVRKCSC